MKAIVVTDQAAGTVGMKLAERPEPPAVRFEVLALRHPLENGVPWTYIACTDPWYKPFAWARDWAKAQVNSQTGWTRQEIASGHDAMVTAPATLAGLLSAIE